MSGLAISWQDRLCSGTRQRPYQGHNLCFPLLQGVATLVWIFVLQGTLMSPLGLPLHPSILSQVFAGDCVTLGQLLFGTCFFILVFNH